MKIQILSKEIELSDELRAYIEKKVLTLSRFVKRMEDKGEMLVHIEVSRSTKHHKTGMIFYAEATMEFAGKILRAEEYEVNIETAVDRVKDRLKNEIIRFKDRHMPSKMHKNRHKRISNISNL